MEGVRVSNIPEATDEKDLKIYFTNTKHGGGGINRIYYPLLNNDAVIIFRDSSVIDTVVTVQHKIGRNIVAVQRLPPVVFTSIEAKLDPAVSDVLLATESCHRALRCGEVTIRHCSKDKCVVLEGNWFQMEFAWEILAKVINRQQSIHMKIYQKKDYKDLSRSPLRLENGYSSRRDISPLSSIEQDSSGDESIRDFVTMERKIKVDAEMNEGKNSYRSLHYDEDSHQTSLKSVISHDDLVPYSSHRYTQPQSFLQDRSGHTSLHYTDSENKSQSMNAYTSSRYGEHLDDRTRKDNSDLFNKTGSQSRPLEGNSLIHDDHVTLDKKSGVSGDKYDELFKKVYITDDRRLESSDKEISSYETNAHVETSLRRVSPRPEANGHVESSLRMSPRPETNTHVETSLRRVSPRPETNGHVETSLRRVSPRPETNDYIETSLRRMSPRPGYSGSKTYTVNKNNKIDLDGQGLPVAELLSDTDSDDHRRPTASPSSIRLLSAPRQRYEDQKRTRQSDENETFSKFSEADKTEALLREIGTSSFNGHMSKQKDEGEELLQSLRAKKESEKPKRSVLVSESMVNFGNYYEFNIGELKVVVKCANITSVETAGLVNPANGSLSHGAGVAGAIARAASPRMEMECDEHVRKYGLLNTCDVIYTRAGGRLSPKITYILHAVGPIWIERLPARCKLELIKTYLNCFNEAEKLWLSSLTVPCISSGIFGVPLDVSIECFLEGVLIFHCEHQRNLHLKEIHLVNNDADTVVTSIVMLQSLLEEGQDNATAKALNNYEKYSMLVGKKLSVKDRTSGIRESPVGRTYQTMDNVNASASTRSHSSTSSAVKTSSVRRTASLDRSRSRKTSYLTESTTPRNTSIKSKTTESSVTRNHTNSGTSGANQRSKTDSDLTYKDRSKSKTLDDDDKKWARKRSSSASRLAITKNTHDSNSSSKTLSSNTRPSTSPGHSSSSQTSPSPRLSSSTSNKTRTSVSDQIKKTSAAKSSPQIKPALQTSSTILSSSKMPSKSKTSTNVGKTLPLRAFTVEQENNDYSLSRSRLDKSETDYMYGSQSLPAHFDIDSFRSSISKQDICSICIDRLKNPKVLKKCGHTFCTSCIEKQFTFGKPKCPVCGMLYGAMKGNQPPGTMTYTTQRYTTIPGYETSDGAIIITYDIPPGKQTADHINPGAKYSGFQRKAYLPNNSEGREVLRLLKKAFDAKLIFTIGFSRTTGKEGVVTWNDIHHKTSIDGGPTRFGYPDSGYLKRVKEELAQFGIM